MALWIKRLGFAAAALYIILSPALPQLAGWGAPYVRPWTMFSGVGAGLPKGEFTARYADGRTEQLSALQVLGAERYPDSFHYEFDLLIHDEASFRDFAAGFCTRADGPATLSFDGRVGAPDGWVSHSVTDLCASPVQIAGDPS